MATNPDRADAAGRELTAVAALIADLDDHQLVLATGCEGWRVAEVVVHMRAGAEGVLTGLASTTTGKADRDAASYWLDWPHGGPATFASTRWTCAQAAAYPRGEDLRQHATEVLGAAARAALQPELDRRALVGFQDHLMSVDDFLSTWAVEFALHHLDLMHAMPDLPGPDPAALQVARVTLDSLLERPCPVDWSDAMYARKGTGRASLTLGERARLGDLATRFPLFG